MNSKGMALRAHALLRKAGLSNVPVPVLACMLCICLVLVCFALWRFWPGAPTRASQDYEIQASGTAVPDLVFEETSSASDSSAASSSAQQKLVMVDVEGSVANPGLYELSGEARVGDAISAAGGYTNDAATAAVNLAQPIEDGMQIYVASEDEAASAPAAGQTANAGSSSGAQGNASRVNLNTATLEQLQTLPGVGPVLAQSILDYRAEHGRFSSVEELKNVSGIGDTRFERLKGKVAI